MKKKRNEMQMRIGANNKKLKRISNDFYATDPAAIDGLIENVQLPKRILEPAGLFDK